MTVRMTAHSSVDLASDLSCPVRTRSRWPANGPPGGSPGIEALIISGNPMNGTTNDDFMFGIFDGPNHTINAGVGDDLVIGDIGLIDMASRGASNNALVTALSLDDTAIWTTDNNPLVGLSLTPHATVYIRATQGQEEFYALSVGAGESITIDIDYGFSHISTSTDTIVDLLDAGGNVIASNNDASELDGDFGSVSLFDAFLAVTIGSGGIYYIRVRESGSSSIFEGNEEFLLNVSVTGHGVTTSNDPGNDTIDGGSDDDQLFGADGDDSINGGDHSDLVHGGSGNDILDGGRFSDTIYGGAGDDTIYASRFGVSGDRDTLIGGTGSDSLVGGLDKDGLRGGPSIDTISAGDGDDRIEFLDGDQIDFVDGGSGTDRLRLNTVFTAGQAVFIDLGTSTFIGLGGTTTIVNVEHVVGTRLDDTLVSGADSVTLDGGIGDDRLEGGENPQMLLGGRGNDTILGNDSTPNTIAGDTIDGNDGDDSIIGGLGNNSINGSSGDDSILCANGNHPITGDDTVNGGDGSDFLTAADGDDLINGGTGLDSVFGDDGADTVFAGDDADAVLGGLGNDSLRGDAGDDTLYGEADNDTLYGGLDFDQLFGNPGNDLLFGEDLADTLNGGKGDDSLDAGQGKDLMVGGKGVDVLFGGDGHDTLAGGSEGDVLNGGNDSDWADYSGSKVKVVADLRTPVANTNDAAGDSYSLIENLRGTTGNDTLNGDSVANRIEGIAGRDALLGRDGADTLAGGAGKDRLTGGFANDDFELASLLATDADTILDFAPGADGIALVGAVFGLPLGALDPTRFVIGGQAQDANDRLIYKAGQGKLYFDPDGNGAQAQVLIATLTGAPTLSAGDIVVI